MKQLVFVCRYIELFRSYLLPIDGGLAEGQRNFRFSRPNFLGWVKIFFCR